MRSSLEVAAPLFALRQDVSPIDGVSIGINRIYISPLRQNSLGYEHAVGTNEAGRRHSRSMIVKPRRRSIK